MDIIDFEEVVEKIREMLVILALEREVEVKSQYYNEVKQGRVLVILDKVIFLRITSNPSEGTYTMSNYKKRMQNGNLKQPATENAMMKTIESWIKLEVGEISEISGF